MDPTKSFDHLDPKLKETYARVMATNTASPNNTPTAGLSSTLTPDSGLSSTPTSFDPTQPAMDSSQLSSSPTLPDPTTNLSGDTGPNPGTGPTINALPTDTASILSPIADATTPAPQPAQETTAPPTSSFFSNPTPPETAPSPAANATMPPIEPQTEQATVTPYAPEGIGTDQGTTEQYAEPLPSPAAVNQSAPHETSALLKVLYIVGAVIFFAVYTIFWIKVFNLPFLF